MIILNQSQTAHSRLGNSFIWMSKIYPFLAREKFDIIFPWAIDNYKTYFSENTFWVKDSKEIKNCFFDIYGIDLTVDNVNMLSRRIQLDYEKQRKLEPFDWKGIILSNSDNNVLYLCGNIEIDSREIIFLIKHHIITIIHEPYDLIFNKSRYETSAGIKSLYPKEDLFEEQKSYIKKHSSGKIPLGLHIRRGDYKKWKDGLYYYEDEFWLREVKKFVKEGYAVWIFSNELDGNFKYSLMEQGAIISDGDFEVDFVRIMLMKKVFGPPSTFTGIARRISNTRVVNSCELSIYKPIKQ